MSKREVCPRCGREGSPQSKAIKNHQGRTYSYLYFAHSEGRLGKTGRVSWCYIGKSVRSYLTRKRLKRAKHSRFKGGGRP